MIILQAFQTTTILPNPELDDSEALISEVSALRTITGQLYTYVKQQDRRKLILTFQLDRLKALELREFLAAYLSSTITLTDHLDRIWRGVFMSNPFDVETVIRRRQTITLEFEGIII